MKRPLSLFLRSLQVIINANIAGSWVRPKHMLEKVPLHSRDGREIECLDRNVDLDKNVTYLSPRMSCFFIAASKKMSKAGPSPTSKIKILHKCSLFVLLAVAICFFFYVLTFFLLLIQPSKSKTLKSKN